MFVDTLRSRRSIWGVGGVIDALVTDTFLHRGFIYIRRKPHFRVWEGPFAGVFVHVGQAFHTTTLSLLGLPSRGFCNGQCPTFLSIQHPVSCITRI